MIRLQGLAAALAVALLLAPSAIAAADDDAFVILSATGPGLSAAPGDLLGGGAEVALGDGAAMTVLDRAGRLYRLTGPCACRLPVAAAGALPKPRTRGFVREENLWSAALPTVRDIVGQPDSSAPEAEPGRSAGTATAPQQPNLWAMSVDSSGNRCVRRGAATLWRARADNSISVDLSTQSLRQAGLTWPAGENAMPLPDHFIIDGEPLVLSLGGQSLQFVLHVLPDTIDETEWGEILIWMAARDCRPQAQFLVDGLNNGTLFPDSGRKPGLSEL